MMLGNLFNMRNTPNLLAAWSLFALSISLPWRLLRRWWRGPTLVVAL